MPRYVGPVPRAQAKEGSMPQLVKKRRSAWAVLAASALFASLLAVAATPVGAAAVGSDDASAGNTSEFDACIGAAEEDGEFTDVSDGHTHKDAINCIAYYGITSGTGDGTTFSPNDMISRAQVATMIVRASTAAGADLDDAMGDKFDDIEEVAEVHRNSINVLAENGLIADGGNFRPDDSATRAEMAVMVVAMLKATSDQFNEGGELKAVSNADLDHFKDARDNAPRTVDIAISQLYELGVASGQTSEAFNPSGDLTRGQMAAFITRALAHTSVRPAGVTAQWNSDNKGEIVVSVRGDDFAPVVDAVVDVFHIPTADAALALNADGTCDSDEVRNTDQSSTKLCEIDHGDDKSDNNGDFIIPLTIETDTTVWLWTGDVGDKFGSDTDVYRLDIGETEAKPKSATRVHISSDLKGDKAKLSSSVTYTVQLQSGEDENTSVGVTGEKPATFTVRLARHGFTTAGTVNLEALEVNSISITTDAEGKATFTVTPPADPKKEDKVDKFRYVITIAPGENAPYSNADSVYFLGDEAIDRSDAENNPVTISSATNGLTFSTEASDGAEAEKITVKSAAGYLKASDEGDGASNSVTVTVTDQYGDGVSGVEITLSSGDTSSTIARPKDKTRSDGTRTFSYVRDSGMAGTEVLTVMWDPDDDGTETSGGTANVEWATAPATGTSSDDNENAILEFDTDTNTIFVGAPGAVVVLNYDNYNAGNDRFDIDSKTSNYADFEKALSKSATIGWSIQGTRPRDNNSYRLLTS